MKKAKDFENLWFRYKTEGEPKNISINQFCMQNGVQFNQFNKWFRNTRKDIVPVVIEDMPVASEESPDMESFRLDETAPTAISGEKPKRILVMIRTSNGLNIKQGNLDYQGLKKLVERLEGLC